MNLHSDTFAIIYDPDTKYYMLFDRGLYFWRSSIADLLTNKYADRSTTTQSLVEVAHHQANLEVLYSYPSRAAFLEAHPELLIWPTCR